MYNNSKFSCVCVLDEVMARVTVKVGKKKKWSWQIVEQAVPFTRFIITESIQVEDKFMFCDNEIIALRRIEHVYV